MNHQEILLALAEAIARLAHEHQTDKAGRPYIYHPQFVSEHCTTMDGKIVGWLHDVVEDTPITIEDLRHLGFDEYLLTALDLVTKKEGPDYDEEAYYAALKQNPIAKEVKLSDLNHNQDITRIPNPTEKNIKKAEYYRSRIKYLQS